MEDVKLAALETDIKWIRAALQLILDEQQDVRKGYERLAIRLYSTLAPIAILTTITLALVASHLG